MIKLPQEQNKMYRIIIHSIQLKTLIIELTNFNQQQMLIISNILNTSQWFIIIILPRNKIWITKHLSNQNASVITYTSLTLKSK